MTANSIRIGTRGSPLALAQAREVRDSLAASSGRPIDEFEIAVIRTTGDRIQDRPLADAGGKGLFTKEIEEALLVGEIDLAVHSMKDVPTVLPADLAMTAMLPRGDVRDAFICPLASSLRDLKPGAVVGTSSLRRAAQVLHLRPDVRIVSFRGNVQTRLQKLADGLADATVLAAAGLARLGMTNRITAMIESSEMLPAVAQGAIGVEIRADDEAVRTLLGAINHAPTVLCVSAERAFLARLEGSCRTPIAGLAWLDGSSLVVRGEILSPDGRNAFVSERRGCPEQALSLGEDLANDLLSSAGPDFLAGGPKGARG